MSQEKHQPQVEFWAIVELFGYQKMAGFVTEVTIGSTGFIRIDVPGDDKRPPFTRLVGAKAIYAINPTTEEVAKAVASKLDPRPVEPWELPRQLPSQIESNYDQYDDEIEF